MWMKTSTRPSLGGCARLSLTWGFGCPVGVGCVGFSLGVGPVGLLVGVLGKYLDPAGDRDWCGPQNLAYGGTNISGDCPHGLSAQGETSNLATCGPVQDVLAQGSLDKIYHWRSVAGSWLVWWLLLGLDWRQDSCSAQLTTGGCCLVFSPRSRFS